MKLQITCEYTESTTYSLHDQQENKFDEKDLKERLKALGFKNIEIKKVHNKRSLSQNSAYWKWLEMIEYDLRDRGMTMDALFSTPTEFCITKEFLHLWNKKFLEVYFEKKSTTEMNKLEFTKFIEELKMIYAKKFDCQIDFPSIDLI